jgi:hypothetical protein
MLSASMLSVIRLSVAAPCLQFILSSKKASKDTFEINNFPDYFYRLVQNA